MKVNGNIIVLENGDYHVEQTKADKDAERWAALMKIRNDMKSK